MEPKSIANTPILILAGGFGTRISEESGTRPKPMVEIGEIPILVHLMKWYLKNGFNDFVILGGYKVMEIKKYFINYEYGANNLEIDHRFSRNTPPKSFASNLQHDPWRVRVLDTGLTSMTGSRVAQGIDLISKQESFENFGVTYGDGLSDVNLKDEFSFHLKHGKIGTVLGIPPPSRFGELRTDKSGMVTSFLEKPKISSSRINGGFFFFRKDFRNFLSLDKDCTLETGPLADLSKKSELMMFDHQGFWQPMDTLRDRNSLQELWDSGVAPWKINSI
jgi:glucose-1-phosphate cytidylyltransferase